MVGHAPSQTESASINNMIGNNRVLDSSFLRQVYMIQGVLMALAIAVGIVVVTFFDSVGFFFHFTGGIMTSAVITTFAFFCKYAFYHTSGVSRALHVHIFKLFFKTCKIELASIFSIRVIDVVLCTSIQAKKQSDETS